MAPVTDPNTLSNYSSIVTEFTTVDVALNFETRTVAGEVMFELKALEDGVKEVVLDTSYLDIKKVVVDTEEVPFTLDDRQEPYGSALHIPLAVSPKKNTTVTVVVREVPVEDDVGGGLTASDYLQHDRQVHRAAMDGARADFQQEASLHVYHLRPEKNY
jgi:aminopeptidase N